MLFPLLDLILQQDLFLFDVVLEAFDLKHECLSQTFHTLDGVLDSLAPILFLEVERSVSDLFLIQRLLVVSADVMFYLFHLVLEVVDYAFTFVLVFLDLPRHVGAHTPEVMEVSHSANHHREEEQHAEEVAPYVHGFIVHLEERLQYGSHGSVVIDSVASGYEFIVD